MSIKSEIVLRVRIAYLFIFLFGIGVIWRIIHIQFFQGDYWKQQARQKTTQPRTIFATRGNIFSDNGSLLATSLPRYRLAFDPSILETLEEKDKHISDSIRDLSVRLAQFFGGEAKDFEHRINDAKTDKKEYMVLSPELISFSDMKRIRQFPIFNKGRYKGGVIFERVDQRYKPFEHLARRTIGFLNADNDGAGLELSFNQQLAGRNGEALFQKIAGGNWKPVYDGEDVKPEPGMDVYTSLDINLQDVAETSLLDALERNEANYGCVVLMEVKTGEIKAMANLGKVGEGKYGETYNYATGSQGRTDPGSTFKLASLMALFEETGLELSDPVKTGNGEKAFFDAVMRDSKKEGHGTITIQEAFEVSSNIAFATLVNDNFRNKPQRFINYLKAFGLDANLGFQLKNTAISKIKDANDPTWSPISLPWIAVGYETQMSPLQILTFYNAVANNGKMIKPLIVKEVRKDDEIIEQYESGVIREKICTDKTLAKLKKCLIGVVERGTAQNIKNPNYKIAGKTGTSQRIKNKKYIENYYTSFAGFFPAENPKYSCIVVIDNPQGFKQYAADVAAPVFKEIADKIYARDVEMHKNLGKEQAEEGIFPTIKSGNADDLQFICNTLKIPNRTTQGLEWTTANVNQNTIFWKRNAAAHNRMPDVTGMTLRDALYVLENKGLKVKWTGRGKVKSQSESPDSRIIKGSIIELELE